MSPPSRFDQAAIRADLEWLHRAAAGLVGDIVVTAYGEDPATGIPIVPFVRRHVVGDIDGSFAAVMSQEGRNYANVYVPRVVMRPNADRADRGREADILAVLSTVADLDADHGVQCDPLPLAPTLAMESSPGNFQHVFSFDRPLTPAEAKPLAAALRRATNADTGTSDIAHVWRVPGTLNWPNAAKVKRGRSPEPVPVRIASIGETVMVDTFRRTLGPHLQALPPATTLPPPTDEKPIDLASLSPRHQELVVNGAARGERSEAFFEVVSALFQRGHSHYAIHDLLEDYPDGIGKKYADRDRLQEEVNRVCEKAQSRVVERFFEPITNEQSAKSSNGIVAQPFRWRDPATFPRREWLYGRHLIRKFLSSTVAPGSVGKTSLSLAELVSMATGRNLCGVPIRRRLRVWMINLEDPLEELERRVIAICLHHKIDPAELDGHLFLNSGRDTEVVVASTTRDGTTIAKPVVEALTAEIKAKQADVIVIDPLVKAHRVSENDNGAIDVVCTVFARIANEANCAFDLVHHVRKTNGAEVTVEDSRGAVALMAASRSMRALNRMTKDEAAKAGVEDPRIFFRSETGKANLAPLDQANWFKLISVSLGNGDGFEAPDYVAVAEPWRWPDPSADITADDLLRVREALSVGRWRENAQAKDWAGKAVAEVLDLDLDDKAQKARVSSLLRTWIASGMLKQAKRQDENREERSYLEISHAG